MSDALPVVPGVDAAKCEPDSTFDDANKGGLSAINAVALLACTLTSAGLALYADLAARAAPLVTGWLAISAWVATLTIALYLAGNSVRQQASARHFKLSGANSSLPPDLAKQGLWVDLTRGASSALQRPVFALLVIFIAAGAVFSAWSKAKSESGSVLASLALAVLAVREDTAVIRREVTRTISPAEQLARLGFTTSTEDVCRAIVAGRLDAFRLMQAVGLPNKAVGISVGGGDHATCIEDELLGGAQPGKPLGDMLAALPNTKGELNRRYLSQIIFDSKTGPVNIYLIARAGRLSVNSGDKLSFVTAPLLMYAVWGGNAQAVSGILKAGADANVSAHLEVARVSTGLGFYAIAVSPLAEAQRLGQAEVVAVLKAYGAQATHSTTRSRFN